MRYGDDPRGVGPGSGWDDYPRWMVFALGVVTGLVISWAQYAHWAAR